MQCTWQNLMAVIVSKYYKNSCVNLSDCYNSTEGVFLMKSVKEMYDYNKNNDYGVNINEKMTYNTFAYCAKQLKENEDVKMSFVGILYYQASAQFTSWYGVLITDQRILVSLYGFFNKEHHAFSLSDYTHVDIDETSSKHAIQFIGEQHTLSIGVLSHRSLDIVNDIVSKTDLVKR